MKGREGEREASGEPLISIVPDSLLGAREEEKRG